MLSSVRLSSPRVRMLVVAATLLVGLFGLMSASAHAAAAPGRVYFTHTAYSAHEDQGELPITIARTDDSVGEDVRYGVRHLDAEGGLDLDTVGNTLVHFYPGESTYTFDVKIVDRGMNATPVYADAYLFGASPQRLGDANGRTYAHGPVNSKITILRDDPLDQRDPLDLLGFTAPTTGTAASADPFLDNPLSESPFEVEGGLSPAGEAARHYAHSRPGFAGSLDYLADQPGVHRFYYWNTPAWPAHTVARYLESVENRRPNTVVQLSTYSLVHAACGGDTSSPAFIKRYERWVHGLARGIGNFHVVMFFELDSLITTQCMTHQPAKLRDRLLEVREGVQTLEALPHTSVYIDAGAADALSSQRDVSLLKRAGVMDAQGFFVNSTHFDWTTKEVAYGQQIAQALGGKHFVVNTGENGQGPLVPKVRLHNGNEELCNPPNRGLGPMSVQTGYTYVDAFLWFTNPGGSGGDEKGCGAGAPPTAVFWPSRAVSLVDHANFHITGPPEHLLHDGPYLPYDAAVAPNASHAALARDNRVGKAAPAGRSAR
jgi:endoglucanase